MNDNLSKSLLKENNVCYEKGAKMEDSPHQSTP
jgi:hypothetical protein